MVEDLGGVDNVKFEGSDMDINNIDEENFRGYNKGGRGSRNLRTMNRKELKAVSGCGIMYKGLETGLLKTKDLTFNRASVDYFLNMYETKKKLKIY